MSQRFLGRRAWVVLLVLLAESALAATRQKTVMVPMRDGTKLATDIRLPEQEGRYPVILFRTPYSRKNAVPSWTEHGYAVVSQDMRGRFDSQGKNWPFVGCGWGECQDGADTVAWILQQPWSNGKIGMWGASATGITENLLAATISRGVQAQWIGVAFASMYHDAAYVGGAFRKSQLETWCQATHFDPAALEAYRAHTLYDDFWQDYDTTRRFERMNIPAVHLGGWFDTFAQGTIDSFVGRQYHGAEGARGHQKLVMGPWTHGGWQSDKQGDLAFPNSRPPKAYDARAWFDFMLKGVDTAAKDAPAVAYYVMGDTSQPGSPGNRWRFADRWPIPAEPSARYFWSDGTLRNEAPPKTVPNDSLACRQYRFDPKSPCPTVGGTNLVLPAGPMAQNKIEGRSDLLSFTTEPLDEPLEFTGRVAATIHVASSAVDTDLCLRFCDVYPDGKSYPMAQGILRLRHRNTLEKDELLEPGKIYEIKLQCWTTSVVINRGHRIRINVTSSNYPHIDLNPGTGKPWSDNGPYVVQSNKIYCDGRYPSRVILPVVR